MYRKKEISVQVHGLLKTSRANGPGIRAVVWFQGCPILCPGCYNLAAQDPSGGMAMPIKDLIAWALSIEGIEGISISGGEPTFQLFPLILFLRKLREERPLSILLFTGKTMEQVLAMPRGRELIPLVDVLIDGPYVENLANLPGTWPSSSNQKIHLLSGHYTVSDFLGLPAGEVVIFETGDVITTGLGYTHNNSFQNIMP